MKALRIVAFVGALGAFIFQLGLAKDAGVNALPIVLGTFGTIAMLIMLAVVVARSKQHRRRAAFVAQRPGWHAATFLGALPAGAPAGTPPATHRTGVLLFSPAGIEIHAAARARAPYELVLAAPWSNVTVTPARVQYVPGRAVTKAGIALAVTRQPTLHFGVIPERSLRAQFPARNAAETVLAAMQAQHQSTEDTVNS